MRKGRFRTYLAALLCASMMCPYFMTILQQGARVLMVQAEEIPVEGECTANELNVRSGPGTDYEQVTSGGKGVVLTKGQKVTILSKKGDWYEIETTFNKKSVKGYCLGTYIKVTKTAEPTPTPVLVKKTVYTLKIPAKIAAQELNFREKPDTGSAVYATLKNGDAVTVLGKEKKDDYLWYYVSAKVDGKTKKGYLVSDYVTFTFDKNFYVKTTAKQGLLTEAAGKEKVVDAAGKALSVAKGKLLYAMSEKSAGGEKWLRVRVTQSDVKYYGYIKLADVELVGLSSTAYVTPTPTPSPAPTKKPAPAEPDADADFAYGAAVTANTLNLRKQASTASEILATLSKDQEVTVFNAEAEEDGIWYRVAATVGKKKLTGYLFSPYVKLDYAQAVHAKVKGGSLKLRSKANAKAVYVTKEDGSILSIANKKNVKLLSETMVDSVKWFEVETEAGGKVYRGYAAADRLTLMAEPTPSPTPSPTQTPSPSPTATEAPTPTPTEEATPSPTQAATAEPSPTSGVSPEPTPEPTPTEGVTPVPTPTPGQAGLPDKGQAKITGVTALALKELPQYGSKLIKNASGFSVVVGTDNVFEVLDVVGGGDQRWCHVVYKQDGAEYIGYINASYVEFLEGGDIFVDEPTPTQAPVVDNGDFEAALAAQNFPESYRAALMELHEKHPTWKFVADHTGLDWETAVDNESVVGRNLISNTKGAEWKSFAEDAYNWKTDTFVVYDGSTWVTASREANAYYMDPRNFLNETDIYQFELLTYEPAYQNLEGVENILRNTAMERQSVDYVDEGGAAASMTYGEIFMRAAEYSGVSPFHLASRVKQEVVVGTDAMSNSVSGTVPGFEGLYNYYNIGAYHSTVAGGAIANGLKYAKNGAPNAALNESMLIPWTDPYRAILGGAYYIGYSYINRGQNTIYLQKFNMTPNSTYSHQYMANIEAPYSEGRKVAGAYEEFGDLPIVFSIPVYLNMPETACGEPQAAYNPNNWLKSLSVRDADGNELMLTPTFDLSVDQEYYIVVENSCGLIEVSAQAASRLATVNGADWHSLAVGNNEIVVSVTAENGDVREYRITVARTE